MLRLFALFISFILGPSAHASIESGVWQLACQNGLKKEQIYRGDQVLTLEHYYSERDCGTEVLRFETGGRVSYPGENPLYIDFVYESLHLSVFHPALLRDFNARGVCGFRDWKAGEEREITGLTCELFAAGSPILVPGSGQKKYGIYQVTEQGLLYGQLSLENDGSAPGKRPQKFNPAFWQRPPGLY